MRPRQKIYRWDILLNTPDKALNTHEVRAVYISAMGQELGADFYELYRELVEFYVLRKKQLPNRAVASTTHH